MHHRDVSAIDAPLHPVGRVLCLRPCLRLRYSPTALSCFPDDMLEALLKPVEAEEDDKGVDGNGVGHHDNKVDRNLLGGVEQVHVDSVQTGLGAARTGKEETINVRSPAVTGAKYDDRA